ncbi:MAG TPA: ferredoxin family protein [Candidatus Binatia bacterium]|nr:ferredoxin family protein [Candidatus Binatia bacterium]
MEPRSKSPEKARRAAAHPDRPGELCKATPGAWVPVVDRARCEAKGDCVEVCPYGVLEVRRIEDDDYRALSFFSRMKVLAHRMRSAYTPRAVDCHACGLCVVACPEHALRLVASGAAAGGAPSATA